MSQSSITRPLVAVTSAERGNTAAWLAARWLLHRAGARAVRVRPSALLESFGPFEGLVILGGVDVDPELYSGLRVTDRRLDARRDARELELIGAALDQRMPLLGLCRGAQLLNVALGGTLERLSARARSALPYRRIWLRPGTELRRVVGRPTTWINTLHDYAVGRLGSGLAISATDSAGVAQAIELAGGELLVIGVQWHPELMPYLGTSRRLFRALVSAARSDVTPARPGSSPPPDRARAW